MNRSELITAMAKHSNLTKKDSEIALDAFCKAIEEGLVTDGKVQLVGFGTFEVSERPARTGRNPKTGEEIAIQASKSPKFKPGKLLKDAVNA